MTAIITIQTLCFILTILTIIFYIKNKYKTNRIEELENTIYNKDISRKIDINELEEEHEQILLKKDIEINKKKSDIWLQSKKIRDYSRIIKDQRTDIEQEQKQNLDLLDKIQDIKDKQNEKSKRYYHRNKEEISLKNKENYAKRKQEK